MYSLRKKGILCSMCKLNETCQNNFDYECIEASDFLFKPKDAKEWKRKHHKGMEVFTVKDDFLDSLIGKKDHNALRG